MREIAVRCQELTKHFGSVKALQSLSLDVAAGSVFGFLGRNGAGKTTAIRLLTGLANPTSGKAWINGYLATDGDRAARLQFGYLPEEPSFYTWMTPTEYLDYGGQIFGLSDQVRKRRIEELLEVSGLEDVARRRIGGFSRGMRQRLGLAQAMIHRPPVLFLDEPTSALDPAGRRDVLELITELRKDATIFLSSHILADVERVCDTIGVIHDGELLLVSDRDDLLSSFGTDVIVLEIDELNNAPIEEFQSRLKGTNWMQSFELDHERIRITVSDSISARREILGIVNELGLILSRYEWVRPSLEEIFLKISAE